MIARSSSMIVQLFLSSQPLLAEPALWGTDCKMLQQSLTALLNTISNLRLPPISPPNNNNATPIPPILRLPAELRLQIYEFLIDDFKLITTLILDELNSTRQPSGRELLAYRASMALSLTCKSIHLELQTLINARVHQRIQSHNGILESKFEIVAPPHGQEGEVEWTVHLIHEAASNYSPPEPKPRNRDHYAKLTPHIPTLRLEKGLRVKKITVIAVPPAQFVDSQLGCSRYDKRAPRDIAFLAGSAGAGVKVVRRNSPPLDEE